MSTGSITPELAPEPPKPGEDDILLSVRGLKKHFPVKQGLLKRTSGYLQAVDGVDLEVRRGETLGLVGESGCGKSTLGRTLLRLLEPTAGEITFDGVDLVGLGNKDLKDMRRHMQIVFQDSVGSLDPRMKVGDLIAEGLSIHGIGARKERDTVVHEMLERVGMPPEAADRYPHQFSGGQRQRIGLARALVLQPKLVVADEPVSALDVSIQSQVLNLLVELKAEFDLTYQTANPRIECPLVVSAVADARQRLELVERRRRCQRPLERGCSLAPRVVGDLLLAHVVGEEHANEEHNRAERRDVGADR